MEQLSVGAWLLACAAGAGVAVDAVSWPQAMWSRPIVAGTIGGALFGSPVDGFLSGACLELLLSRHSCSGAARRPETGPAALTAGAACGLAADGAGAAAGLPTAAALPAAVAAGWAIAWVGTYSVSLYRAATARFLAAPDGAGWGPAKLARRHRLAIALDGVRGGLVVGALLVPSALFVRLLSAAGPDALGPAWAPAVAAISLAGVGGSVTRGLGTRRESWHLLLAGGLLGLLLLRVLA